MTKWTSDALPCASWFQFQSLNMSSTRFSLEDADKHCQVRLLFGQLVLWSPYRMEEKTKDTITAASSASTSTACNQQGRHLTTDMLVAYRQLGDPEVDQILKLLDRAGRPLGPGEDLLVMAERAADAAAAVSSNHSIEDEDECSSARDAHDQTIQNCLANFWNHYHSHELPSWVDVEQLQLGQQVFVQYFAGIALSLFYRGLVPGFSIPKIAAVICATNYLAPPSSREQVQARLLDTGALLSACLVDGLDGILPGGTGWRAALQVRILHAKVRHVLLHRKKKAWNAEVGVPINQEDMAATLLAFSTNALLGLEFLLGRPIPTNERLAYIALWRYIGWLLGVHVDGDDFDVIHNPTIRNNNDEPLQRQLRPLDPCGPGWIQHNPDPLAHSYAMLQSIIFHLMKPDATSTEIALHLLRIGRNNNNNIQRPFPKTQKTDQSNNDSRKECQDNNWFYFRALQCRRFVGNPLADALKLPFHPRWTTRWFLWTMSTLYLTLARLYLVASACPWSPFRRSIRSYHERKLQFFHARWKETHGPRVAKALKGKLNHDDKNDADDEKVANGKDEDLPDLARASASFNGCPFAMVVTPSLD